MRTVTKFVCQQCGTESPKWMGRCPNCGEWNSMVETRLVGSAKGEIISSIKPQKLSEIKLASYSRMKTGLSELDLVLGGGIVPGSVILVAGEPGIGKSTLMLQLACQVSRSFSPVLYISGEESLQQIKIRAQRLNFKAPEVLFLAETNTDTICTHIKKLRPKLVIIDSIQTCWTNQLSGSAGSIGQVRESAAQLLRLGKEKEISIFLIGHVTKSGAIAGPKVLEHMVDAVIYLEGEKFGVARLLRATKNRFGATDEVGVFEMTDNGMVEISNPSMLFLKHRVKKVPGSVVSATLEGTRPILVEIQALTVASQLPIPRRVAQGVDFNRLQLIIAILTKRLNLGLGGNDIIVNVTGGIKIQDPGVDLGIALAIFSSFKNIPIPVKAIAFGEVGLLGELRPVFREKQRIKEGRRFGFTKIISPSQYSTLEIALKSL